MKKHRITEKFLAELRKVPIIQVAAERCDISRTSVYRWRKEDEEFKKQIDDALEEGVEFINDMCESQLFKLIKNESFSAIRFWLINRHKDYMRDKKRKRVFPWLL